VRVSCTHYSALYSDHRLFSLIITTNEKTPNKTRYPPSVKSMFRTHTRRRLEEEDEEEEEEGEKD
jgi:hypothetical protein